MPPVHGQHKPLLQIDDEILNLQEHSNLDDFQNGW